MDQQTVLAFFIFLAIALGLWFTLGGLRIIKKNWVTNASRKQGGGFHEPRTVYGKPARIEGYMYIFYGIVSFIVSIFLFMVLQEIR